MPRSDSSETYMRAVRPKPSPTDLLSVLDCRCLRGLPVLVHEVSRRAVGSSTTPGQTGTRAIAPVYVAFRALQRRRRPDCIFSELNTHPTYSPVYASPCTSRCPTQNSGPSGSLLLSREASSSSASCRFSPAHCNRIFHQLTCRNATNIIAFIDLRYS